MAVFGAGIAGLTVAHELVRRGHRVSVYEALPEAGGFFRSKRTPGDRTPSEYSWHGFGPWYHNTFDLLRQIPFDDGASLYDKALSRPIDFGLFPDQGGASFYGRGLGGIRRLFRFSGWEFVRWGWLMLKTWTARRRSEEDYARRNAGECWGANLGVAGDRTWRACFGPWIGSDWTRVSLHTTGQFFRKQLFTRPTHQHAADEEGPAWSHGAGDGWLLLRGPSSEFWFGRWVPWLAKQGVAFHWHRPLARLEFDGRKVGGAWLESGERVEATNYVLATSPFAAAEIVARTPALERLAELRKLRPLVRDGPHVQVAFRLAFAEPIRLPRPRVAVVVADSEFNLTLFAQEQVWRPEVDLGQGVMSLWTGTSCAATVPGRVHGLPVIRCTREQFIDELRAQIASCGALDALVAEANGGRRLASFPPPKIEVWHEWVFSEEGISGPPPKWVTTTNTQPYQPSQTTPVENLFLAGAHTRTEADVWSIEGAVESGRRAARATDPRVAVISQYTPRWLRVLGAADDLCHRLGAPHVLDLSLAAAALTLAGMLVWAVVALNSR